MTTISQTPQVADALKPLTPLENLVRAGQRLGTLVRQMKDEASLLESLIEKDIEASAYAAGYDLGREAKADARLGDPVCLAFDMVERDLLKLIKAHADAQGQARPEGWGYIDQMAADITSRSALHMLGEGRDYLRHRIRDAVAHGMRERNALAD